MSPERIVKAPKHTGKVTRNEARLAVKVVHLKSKIRAALGFLETAKGQTEADCVEISEALKALASTGIEGVHPWTELETKDNRDAG